MKSITRFLINPVTISLFFCCLLISGRHSAVFYGFVLQLGIMHGVFHAILGTLGVALLLSSVFLSRSKIRSLTNLAGILCMIGSLIRFFLQPKGDYNYNTFRESVPCILMIAFGCVLLVNAIYYIRLLKASKV